MEESFEIFRSDVSSKQLRSSIETLIKIFRNIHQNPTEDKFKSIKLSNKKFDEDIWRFENARKFMKMCGWVINYKDGEQCLVYPEGKTIKEALMFLIDNRDVKPLLEEWVDETKKIIPNAENERERQLRAEAKIKKEKEMIALKKDMAERKQIAESIRKDIIDNRKKNKLHYAPAKALVPSQMRESKKTTLAWSFLTTAPPNVLGASPSASYGSPRSNSPDVNQDNSSAEQ